MKKAVEITVKLMVSFWMSKLCCYDNCARGAKPCFNLIKNTYFLRVDQR